MLKPADTYALQKTIWTDRDFDEMGWHDVIVHALAFDTDALELMLDLDYMFAWVEPEPPSPYYSFWLSPCTLVFHGVRELKMEYDASLGLTVHSVSRTETPPHWRWNLDCIEGTVSFTASGYTQFTRRDPVRHSAQAFALGARGGISFDRPDRERT